MTTNRLGALLAVVLGVGWLVAVGINLFLWTPKIWGLEPGSWDDARLFLTFVRDNAVSWRVFHVGTTAGLMALVGLVPLLGQVFSADERERPLTAIGLVGAVCALLASLIDHLGTPVLARLAAGNVFMAETIWEFVEPWRDAGLKTVSYWFLGFWALWLGGRWLIHQGKGIGRFSQVMGGALLLLALIESMTPPPLIYTLGETGVGGLVFFFFPVWGLWTGRWFWQREVAEIRG